MSTMMTESEMMRRSGGKKLATGANGVTSWDFGWQPSSEESLKEAYAQGIIRDHDANEDVPEIKGPKVMLSEAVKEVFGTFIANWQLTGSCVNGGGFTTTTTRIAMEILKGIRSEGALLPFTLIAYGQARGSGRSEGSGASATEFAAKLKEVGAPPFGTPGLPAPLMLNVKNRTDAKVVVFTEATAQQLRTLDSDDRRLTGVELRFSASGNHKQEWLDVAKKFNFQYVRCRSAEEVKRELRRGRPITCAGMWGGKTQGLQYVGEPRVLMNTHSSSWSHQQSIPGFWEHPTLGDIFFWLNQWFGIDQNGMAVPVHGEVTNGEPPGGYWTASKDVDWQINNDGEVYAIYDHSGFDAPIDWRWSA